MPGLLILDCCSCSTSLKQNSIFQILFKNSTNYCLKKKVFKILWLTKYLIFIDRKSLSLSLLELDSLVGTHKWCWTKYFTYSWFHIKGTWIVHSFNGEYLSIPEGTGSYGYLFHEIPCSLNHNCNFCSWNQLSMIQQRYYIDLLSQNMFWTELCS